MSAHIGYAIHSAEIRPQGQDRAAERPDRGAKFSPSTANRIAGGSLSHLRAAIVHSQARGITRARSNTAGSRVAQLRRRRQRNSIRQSRRSNDWLNSGGDC